MSGTLTSRERRWLVGLVLLLCAVRLATLGAYPVMDSTESRYAEIARKMLETGDWLVPQFDYGVPFWGKPPLSMWLSAASMGVFGVNEFAARLPSLLAMIGCGALIGALGALRGGRDQAVWTLALFAATGLVFVAAGSVMTDPALVLGTTLSMAGFWVAVHGDERYRRRAAVAFFAGLVVGLLAKGPVTLVLVFVPIVGITLWTRSWRIAGQRLPWIAGALAVALAAGSWYWSAQRASPGFLEYFLVGEHWKRFVEPGWKGDLYGAAHSQPRGLIWILWIAAALPWSAGALAHMARAVARRDRAWRSPRADPWRVYLALWAMTPMLFFTPAGNILITYVLPGLPAFALLVADLWRPEGGAPAGGAAYGALRPRVRTALVAGAAVPALFVAGIVAFHGEFEQERSQKALIGKFAVASDGAASRLVYFPQRPASAEFYSRGTAKIAPDVAALLPYLADPPIDLFAMREQDIAELPRARQAQLDRVGAYGKYRLFREATP
ncbi:MAG: glycosyltransferase family 39 protein [Casimicrobiaceae bacterium]